MGFIEGFTVLVPKSKGSMRDLWGLEEVYRGLKGPVRVFNRVLRN